jgi:branched-chain amino acid transport system substrate-binding protein
VDRRKFLTITGSGALLGLAGCGGCSKKGGNVIKIFSSMPRTGNAQGQTDTIVNGIRMAIDEYNGEVAGFKIDYTDLDDATAATGDWTPEAETTNAQKAEADPDVMVFIGPYNTGAAEISMPILNQAGIFQISPAVTGPQLTKPGFEPGKPEAFKPSGRPHFCRVVPTDDVQSLVGAVFIHDHLKKKTVYLLDDRSPYGKGIANLFIKVAADVGLQIIGRDDIDKNATDYKGLMRKLANDFKPEVVYFGGTTQTNAGQIAKDLKAALPNCKLVVPDGCYENSFITSAGADTVNGRTFVTFGGLDPSRLTGKGKKFVDNYTDRFKGPPEGYAIYGYEAAKVALEAINTAKKKDRDAIREAGLATSNFDGALGKWSFDKNGDTTQAGFTVSKIENGKFMPDWEPTGEELQKYKKS